MSAYKKVITKHALMQYPAVTRKCCARLTQQCMCHLLSALLAHAPAPANTHLSTACHCMTWFSHTLTHDVVLCAVGLQECDELVELQVAARVARIREVELAAARQEAAAK